MQPKVSVIIPVYNVERYLDRCMQSILNQTLQDIEIILVDDGAPGHCPQMCDEYAIIDKRVRVIHQDNVGAGLARNAGIKIATGEFLSFIDSDDYVELSMLEKMYTLAQERNLEAVSCGIKNFNQDGSLRSLEYAYPEYHETNSGKECMEIAAQTIAGGKKNMTNNVVVRHRLSVWHFLFSSSPIHEHNIEFPSERIVLSEDGIFNVLFLSYVSRIGFTPEYLVNHCYNFDSLTATRNKVREYEPYKNTYWCLKNFCDLSTNGEILRNAIPLFFLNRIKSNIRKISKSDLPYKEKCERIKIIVEDDRTWHSISKLTTRNKLSFLQSALIWMATHNCYHLLLLLYSL